MACSTAARLSTGSVPGSAMSRALVWRLGSAPKAVEAPEKILEAVVSWAWTSSPMTTSQLFLLMIRACSQLRGRLGEIRKGCRSRRRPALVPIGNLLVAVRDVQQAGFVKMIADQLQPDR